MVRFLHSSGGFTMIFHHGYGKGNEQLITFQSRSHSSWNTTQVRLLVLRHGVSWEMGCGSMWILWTVVDCRDNSSSDLQQQWHGWESRVCEYGLFLLISQRWLLGKHPDEPRKYSAFINALTAEAKAANQQYKLISQIFWSGWNTLVSGLAKKRANTSICVPHRRGGCPQHN